ncbi:hypothetical protein [Deinococcus yavapaiensis]|uniref:hypothetical protein n=1 Tax=Deinococcus yavapaiensis TaxID=309889 RepID=UPI001472A008|nr:hypothetical protein [Deinococcus yavapaiensis]
MSKRKASVRPESFRAVKRVYRAGCGRSWELVSEASDFAYTRQEFADCPTCPHRVEAPESGAFCTLRPQDAPHPFASLASLKLTE